MKRLRGARARASGVRKNISFQYHHMLEAARKHRRSRESAYAGADDDCALTKGGRHQRSPRSEHSGLGTQDDRSMRQGISSCFMAILFG